MLLSWKGWINACAGLVAFLTAGQLHAQVVSEVLGFELYPQAKIIKESARKVDDYQLAKGVYLKVGGVWRNTSIERLEADVARLTIELPATHSYEMGYEFYREQLAAYSAKPLYECEKRDCGSSNSWANNHFKVYQLYGSDQHQRYGVYEYEVDEQKNILVLYSVRRGNGRVYMQIEHLIVADQQE